MLIKRQSSLWTEVPLPPSVLQSWRQGRANSKWQGKHSPTLHTGRSKYRGVDDVTCLDFDRLRRSPPISTSGVICEGHPEPFFQRDRGRVRVEKALEQARRGMNQQLGNRLRRVVRHDTQYCEQNASHHQQRTRRIVHTDGRFGLLHVDLDEPVQLLWFGHSSVGTRWKFRPCCTHCIMLDAETSSSLYDDCMEHLRNYSSIDQGSDDD